jgi:superfamily II DNA or RNA helicase
LVFTADTETAYAISRKHLMMPLTSEIGRKEREETLSRYKTGELKAIVSCRVLNEGFDVPDAEIGIILGGALGQREHIQRIGRLLRPLEGKKAIIYELVCRGTIEIRQWKRRNDSFDSSLTA